MLLPEAGLVFVDRADGGHLIVNPPRPVWERSELAAQELVSWSFLVAAVGRAMLDTLPQLAHGCVNYFEAGNWALNDAAPPAGRKSAREHRSVHMHVFGRSPNSADPSWRWGEAPRLPEYKDRHAWAAGREALNETERDAVAAAIVTHFLKKPIPRLAKSP